MTRSRQVAGTSYAEREALRALDRACQRAGGPISLRKLETAHAPRVAKLRDRALVHSPAGQPRTYRSLSGVETTYEERLYALTAKGRALLERTADEQSPAPTPLRDEHWTLLALLVGPNAPRTAASVARRAGGRLDARQAGQRLSLLARHGYATDIRGDYMEPTSWYVTAAGETALAARETDA